MLHKPPHASSPGGANMLHSCTRTDRPTARRTRALRASERAWRARERTATRIIGKELVAAPCRMPYSVRVGPPSELDAICAPSARAHITHNNTCRVASRHARRVRPWWPNAKNERTNIGNTRCAFVKNAIFAVRCGA